MSPPIAHHLSGAHAEWAPDCSLSCAARTGPATASAFEESLSRRAYPEHGFRSRMGIISLGKRLGQDYLEVACERAPAIKGVNYRSIKSFIEDNLDKNTLPQKPQLLPVTHENIAEQINCPDVATLTFQERFGLLVDYQMTAIENKRMLNRLINAMLRLSASIEVLDFRFDKSLDRAIIMSLAMNQRVKSRYSILITRPTGAGKSYLACALSQKACRNGHSSHYQRQPKLTQEITNARLDGRYNKIMSPLVKCEVLILNDLRISLLSLNDLKELLKTIEDLYDRKATIFASQPPIKA